MRYNAKSERWLPMEIKGVRGYYSDVRIDRMTVPDEFSLWELADRESDGIPCRYKSGIMVNFYGTFITTGELPIDCPKCQEGFIDSDDEWGFIGDKTLVWNEVVEDEKQRHEAK